MPDAGDRSHGGSLQSPLHMAIVHNHPDVVSVILEQKGTTVVLCDRVCFYSYYRDCDSILPFCITANALHATNNLQIIPDFSLKDSLGQTVLGLALWTGTTYYESFSTAWPSDKSERQTIYPSIKYR